MDPLIVKKLLQDFPELRAFRTYLAQQAISLNDLSDISAEHPFAIAVETKARQRAYQKLVKILGDLMEIPQSLASGNRNKEYDA